MEDLVKNRIAELSETYPVHAMELDLIKDFDAIQLNKSLSVESAAAFDGEVLSCLFNILNNFVAC